MVERDGRKVAEWDTKNTMLPLSEVLAELRACGAESKVLLVDGCRNDPKTGRGRGFGTAFNAGDLPENLALMLSCSNGERAWEDRTWKHGAFFYHVLKGIGEGRARLDGRLTANSLTAYVAGAVRREVPQVIGGGATQRPHTIVNGFVDLLIPDGLPAGDVITNSLGMKLKRIPAGEFMMGGDQTPEEIVRNDPNLDDDDKRYFTDEQPPHRVRITWPFYLGVYEVTQKEYETIMGSNPSAFSPGGYYKSRVAGQDTSRFPVEQVTWYDAVEFCNRLSQREGLSAYYTLRNVEREDGQITKADVTVAGGKGYRLPTEAEWEYACRAGTTTPFHFGNVNNGHEANVGGDHPFGTTTKGPGLYRTTTVGSYPANRFGLHDMHGNVWEWCEDWYDKDYYARSPREDPVNRTAGLARVLRGGSWFAHARLTRSAFRNRFTPDFCVSYGFRLARTP